MPKGYKELSPPREKPPRGDIPIFKFNPGVPSKPKELRLRPRADSCEGMCEPNKPALLAGLSIGSGLGAIGALLRGRPRRSDDEEEEEDDEAGAAATAVAAALTFGSLLGVSGTTLRPLLSS